MDSNTSPGRFLAFTTANPSTLQTPGDSPGPLYRRASSGSDSGSSGESGVADPTQSPQHAQPAFGAQRAHFEPEYQPYDTAGHLVNANATIYVEDSPYIPQDVPQAPQSQPYAQAGPHSQIQAHFYHNHARMPPPASQHHSHFGPTRHSSGGNSPNSTHSAGSDRSGHLTDNSQRSVLSGADDHEKQNSRPNVQIEGPLNVDENVGPQPLFNPERYPAYDANARRVGMDHIRYDSQPHDTSGRSYYRSRTSTYPGMEDGPHVMAMSLNSPNSSELSSFSRPTPPSGPLPPATPQAGYQTRAMSIGEGQTGYSMPPGRPTPQRAVGHPSQPASQSGVPTLPDPSPNLRTLLGLGPDEEVNLYSLADPEPGQKPNYPYPTLIKLAIHGSPKKRLTLQEIYAALEERFQWFRDNSHDKAWQNSIRHNLSLNKCFRRITKPITEPGKGSYWIVDYSEGEGNKRARKRNKRPTKAEMRRREEEAAKNGTSASRDDSSSSDEDRTAGNSRSQSATSATIFSQFSPAPRIDEANIDPELRYQEHVVGQGRVRTNTTSSAFSTVRRANSPYARSPARGHRTDSPTSTTLSTQPVIPVRQNAAFGQVAFGQPAFGQVSFKAWPTASFSTGPQTAASGSLQQSAWPAMVPQANLTSAQSGPFMRSAAAPTSIGSDMPMGRITRSMAASTNQMFDIQHAPIRQPTQSAGTQHVGDPNGLLAAGHLGSAYSPAQANSGGNSSSSSRD